MPVTLTVEMGFMRVVAEVELYLVMCTVLSCSLPCCVLCSRRVGRGMLSVASDVQCCIPCGFQCCFHVVSFYFVSRAV